MATGHIRKRTAKNGTNSYQIIIEEERDPLTGKRERHYQTINGTKKQAEAALRKLLDKVEGGGILHETSVKLDAWMQQWLELYVTEIAATTRASYKEKIRNYIQPHLGHIPLKALNNLTIQKWVNHMSNELGLSPKTIRNTFNILKPALDKAVVLKMIPGNPCTGTKLPKAVKHQTEIYDQSEIEKMLDKARGTDMYLPLILEASLGLRRGELLALRWDDVDLINGIIHIRHNTVVADGVIETKAPKSAAGIRDLTIGQNLLELLQAARQQYMRDLHNQGSSFTDSNLVIRQPNGKPYRPESMTQKWERFVKANGLKPIRFHDLRHSCTTTLLQAGVDPKTVQTRMGHADISVTMNTYAHTTKSMDQKAADKMDELLFGVG